MTGSSDARVREELEFTSSIKISWEALFASHEKTAKFVASKRPCAGDSLDIRPGQAAAASTDPTRCGLSGSSAQILLRETDMCFVPCMTTEHQLWCHGSFLKSYRFSLLMRLFLKGILLKEAREAGNLTVADCRTSVVRACSGWRGKDILPGPTAGEESPGSSERVTAPTRCPGVYFIQRKKNLWCTKHVYRGKKIMKIEYSQSGTDFSAAWHTQPWGKYVWESWGVVWRQPDRTWEKTVKECTDMYRVRRDLERDYCHVLIKTEKLHENNPAPQSC